MQANSGRYLGISYETIKLAHLCSLPTYKPHNDHIDRHTGSACFLDAPGYPSYFLQTVYSSAGNEGTEGVDAVIRVEDVYFVVRPDWWRQFNNYTRRISLAVGIEKPRQEAKNWDTYQVWMKAVLDWLYRPLPEDHPRVQAWINYVWGYFRNCYEDPTVAGPERKHVAKLKIGLGLYSDVARFAEALSLPLPTVPMPMTTEEAKQDVEWHNLYMQVRNLTYRPITYIREWYPKWEPLGFEREGYGMRGVGDWWERCARKPQPHECWNYSLDEPHAKNGTWCQWCGWVKEEEPKNA